MIPRRTLLTGLLILTSGVAMGASTPSFMAPEKTMSGIIQGLDFSNNTMIFEGYRFRMAPDVQVEIRGSYGAFTMLREGMKATVTYRVISGTEREVVLIKQLPDNFVLERA